MHESAGDISSAANVLQDVHVETYGSLSKREKLDFILEQVRMVLKVRASIKFQFSPFLRRASPVPAFSFKPTQYKPFFSDLATLARRKETSLGLIL